ncbi:ATP-dependent Clp protease ATP-binding subunit [Candidatus Saccharibacteria bacterium]|nr:ATP-dependent Clp protease ATP-binding subunit [Candidatus Saccharibacteria bacterium]
MDEYRYNSVRAKKSRLGRLLKPRAIRVLLVVLAVLGIGGFGLLIFYFKNAAGWLGITLAIICIVLLLWEKNDLHRVPIGKTEDINDILSANVICALGKNPTPAKFMQNYYITRSGRFLSARFGITKDFLEMIVAQVPDDMTPIYKMARELRKELNAEVIGGALMAVAIIAQHPEHERLLNERKLSLQDLINGVDWYNHLYGLLHTMKKRRRDGGIARDFSFGYTPLLNRYSTNVSEARRFQMKTQIHLASHREIVGKMIEAFSKGGRQNIALVGPEGAGRMTIVNAFAETLMDADAKIPSSLKYRQVMSLDASSMIASAGERGELEGLVQSIMAEAYNAKNIILCLNNAQLFFEEGVGSVNIANVLMPFIDTGRLRIVLTMDDQKYLEIVAKNSTLANKLNKVVVEPAGEDETMLIMEDEILSLESKYKVVYQYLALKESYRLSNRYMHDLEMPGKALNLLESSANYANGGIVTMESVQAAIEKTKGVKLSSANNESDREKLLNLEDMIRRRMVGQDFAVKTVSDAMRRAAAGVRNQKKPIGTFLFLGPTGVGKTELSKSLAEVYFNGEDNMIRLDMNEFVTEGDVRRLIEEGKDNAESLTAQVMTHPFSVVLLDEIEKAHPAVLTTLLQLLDEGVLRDAKNREVSFRDAIVIATSNAGADRIRQYVEEGRDLAQAKEEIINELIERGEFKPEFVNRFDEICVFVPLTKADLVQIVELNMKTINKTLEPKKIRVTLGEGAAEELAEQGYDPKMGARPLKRTMQKTVENIVARKVLEGEADSGAEILITREMLLQ